MEEPKVYEYECEDCGDVSEEERLFEDRGAPTTCFMCGGVAYHVEDPGVEIHCDR